MRSTGRLYFQILFVTLLVSLFAQLTKGEVLYVDRANGQDINPGTQVKPLQTIQKAAELVNNSSSSGPTTIVISAGVYSLDKYITFANNRPYTQENRLTIRASVLPDDPGWTPQYMPIILSTEDSRDPKKPDTYGIKIKVSHVTIRGLKFLGSPNDMYAPIERIDKGLEDLLVTQCMFVGDKDSFDIYCPAIATENQFVVDHCIFHNCHASAVFWDGPESISGKNNAMRYCIVDGAYISGVWTCQTAEDFEYHHNVVTNSEYFWMRKSGDRQKYKIDNCVIIGNKYFSGYGTASGPISRTGEEITFEENGIIKKGIVIFETNKKSRLYMHVVPGTLGSDLGAGLFMQQK